ncbi:MAG: hypothetical protein FWC16_10555 [Defluviitaleaceae bacterium]|nr:hypothetical protein [Defluviitaleaceae bacterium]MCL2275357.1 hypothetical protein [Defluviitaleaceae bacterium]
MKTFINTPLLIEQLKRFIVIPLALLAVYLLGIIMPMHTAREGVSWTGADHFMALVLTHSHPATIFTMVAFPLIVAFALFPNHFNGVTNTAFAGFPVNKRQMFYTNVLAGFIMLVIPLFLLCLMLLVPVHLQHFRTEVFPVEWGVIQASSISHASRYLWPDGLEMIQQLNTFTIVAGFFLRNLLGIMVYFALGITAVSISGSRVVSIILAGIISFLPLAIVGLGWSIAHMYLFGFSTTGNFFIDEILYMMHPVMMSNVINDHRWSNAPFNSDYMWVLYIGYAVLTVVYFAVARFCCLRRRAETAGDSVAFVPLKNVLIFLMSLVGMIAMGVFFIMVMGGGRGAFYVGFVVGFVLVYFLAQMLAEKTLHVGNKVRKLPIFGGVAVGLYLLMLLVTNGFLWGYVTRVPGENEIAGIQVQHFWGSQREGVDFIAITDPDIIARTREIHQEIINERRSLRRLVWNAANTRWSWEMQPQPLPIVYYLHNGATVTRNYTLPPDFMQRIGVEDLLREEAVILSRFAPLHHPHTIAQIEIRLPAPFLTITEIKDAIELLQQGADEVRFETGWFTIHDIPWLEQMLAEGEILIRLQEHGIYDIVLREATTVITDPAEIRSLVEALKRDTAATGIIERQRNTNEVEWSAHPISIQANIHSYREGHDHTWTHHIRLLAFDYTLDWLMYGR